MRLDEEIALLAKLLEAAQVDLRAGNERAGTSVAVLEQMIVEREREVADDRAGEPVRFDG